MKEALFAVFGIQIESINFFGSNSKQLNIVTADLIAFTPSYFEMQLTFQYPDYITLSLVDPDLLHVKVNQPELFIDKKSFARMEEDYEFSIRIPPQMSEEKAALLAAVSDTVSDPVNFVAIATTVGQLAMAYGLKQLWNMVNLF